MEAVHRNCLRQNHVTLVDELDPCNIIDYLYQDGILAEDDCDDIKSGKTRKEKCRFLLLLLQRRGPSAYGSFLKSLKVNYDHLAHLLRCSLHDAGRIKCIREEHGEISSSLQNRGVTVLCSKCSEAETALAAAPIKDDLVKACSKYRRCIPKCAVPKLERLIKQNCCLILGNVEANDLLDLHYQEFMLGVEGYERIKSGNTRLERCIMFISELSKCTCSRVTSVFKSSLEKKYGFIVNELRKPTPPMPLVSSPRRRSRNLEKLFNHTSTMLTQGDFQKFKNFAMYLKLKHSEDMMCILDYFHASCDLNMVNIDSAERHVNTGMQRVARTSNPNYFMLELFSAQIRVNLAQQKLGENIIDDAKMIISSDPVGCFGGAAGWLFMNVVKLILNHLAVLNVHHKDYPSVYKSLQGKAVKMCNIALDIFNSDGGNDGRFGHGFALCRLSTLLLRCGENGLTMGIQHPDSEDVELAGKYLQQLENVPIPKGPKVHFLIAKSDLQYRRDNQAGAVVHAKEARKLAREINMKEYVEYANNRVVFLKTLPVSIEAVDEEEVSLDTVRRVC